MKKKTALTALVLVFSLLLAGCSGFLSSQPDASALVKGNLDVIYLNEYSDEYKELLATTPTDEELEQTYLTGLEAEADYFMSYFEVVEDQISEETYQSILDLYKEIYNYSKYEVGEAVKSDDKYLVEVTIYPIDIMQKVMDEDADTFMADWQARGEAGEFNDMTEAEFEETWAQEVIAMVAARVDSIGYLDPQTISVQVVKDDDGLYVIDEDDFNRIDAYIIQY